MVEIKFKKSLLGVNREFDLEIDLRIKEGEFVALMGESGSGKSTTLRVLAGLESARGEILVEGRSWLSLDSFLPPQKREVGFVFQDYALFENMTVLENLLFVSKDKKLADHLLSTTQMIELRDRLPSSLSGGQKQRVALARALMRRPKLLLMDEPLSALDSKMRIKLQDEIKALHREFGMTTIMVSHDPMEVYRLADRVLVLEGGKVVLDDKKEAIKRDKITLLAQVVEVGDGSILVSLGGEIVKIEAVGAFEVGDEVKLSINHSDITL